MVAFASNCLVEMTFETDLATFCCYDYSASVEPRSNMGIPFS